MKKRDEYARALQQIVQRAADKHGVEITEIQIRSARRERAGLQADAGECGEVQITATFRVKEPTT